MNFFEKILGGNILYYPGCLTKFVLRDFQEKYKKILRKLNIDFIELKELEVCCGSPALKAGYLNDFKKLAEKNFHIFKEHAVKKIITNCPACALVFKTEYPKVLGEKWDLQIEHITQTIFSKISLKDKKIKNKKITYHDPCHLGRQLGIFEEPREIIKNLGYEIEEMELNRKESFCCGGGGGVVNNEPELAKKIAFDRINQAKKTKAEFLCTACPLCYLHLKENSPDLEIKELSQLFEELD
jgi:Fe-S oxidoreductase